MADCSQIKMIENAFDLDRGERISGVLCLVPPILVRQDDVLGSICVCGPSSRVDTDKELARIQDAVLRTANMIQVNLNYSEVRRQDGH